MIVYCPVPPLAPDSKAVPAHILARSDTIEADDSVEGDPALFDRRCPRTGAPCSPWSFEFCRVAAAQNVTHGRNH